jgi:hypothetical protein
MPNTKACLLAFYHLKKEGVIVIAHAADQDTGIARITYDHICDVAGLSRAKLSNGLDVLKRLQ